MSDLTELQKILQSTGESIARDIAEAQGLSCDFVVSVTPLTEYAIVIEAGYPPTMTISSDYILSLISSDTEKDRKKAKMVLRRKLSRMVSLIPKMERTLALVPIAEAIAMQAEAMKVVRTAFPQKVIYKIPESHLEIKSTYTISVREISTGISVTLTGENESVTRAKAISQLTSLVSMNDILIQKLSDEAFVPEIKPSAVSMSANPSEDMIKYDYPT